MPCRCGSNEFIERPEGRIKNQPFCAVCGTRLQTASQLTFTQRVIIALIALAVVLIVMALLVAFAPIWWTIAVGVVVLVVLVAFIMSQAL